MEHFATIQGEGFHTGKPAYFIRLGGCDVGCHWCDVKESWPLNEYNQMSANQLRDLVLSSGLELVVITGGEPAMHDLEPLTSALREANLLIHIETSGAHELTGTFDWITFSPKKFKHPLQQFLSLANELKVVVFNKSDLQFAEDFKAKVDSECKLFLQPEWDKKDQMIPLVTNYIKEHSEWRISLQTHKYMNVP